MERKEDNEEEVAVVNESGLYALVFMSEKKACREFRKWVTSEVLPQIRTTGCYVADEKASNNPIFRMVSSGKYRHQGNN